MLITAYFSDQGSPATGLSPVVSVIDLSDDSKPVDGQAMDEIAEGFYKYDYEGYSDVKSYAILCDGGSSLSGTNRYSIGTRLVSNIITAFFFSAGIPATGLSPTIDIYDVSDDSKDVDGEAMSEVSDGYYKYTFTGYDSSKSYLVMCDGGATLKGWERYSIGATLVTATVREIIHDGINITPVLPDGKIGVDTKIMSGEDLVAEFTLNEISVKSIVANIMQNVQTIKANRIKVQTGVL